MEDKPKKIQISMSGLFLIIAILVIAVMGVYIYMQDQNAKLEVAKLEEDKASLQNTVNELQGKVDEVANIVNETPTMSSDNVKENTATNQRSNNQSNTAVDEVKKSLKDESWLKKNIYIQKSESSEKNITDQIMNFIVCKGDDVPVIIVEVESQSARFRKSILVTYENNSVKAEKICESHIDHGNTQVDANKNVVNVSFAHMGDEWSKLEKITGGNIQFIGKYRADNNNFRYFISENTEKNEKEVTETEYENYKNSLERQYNFVDITTKMTNQNIDKYIK